MPLYRHDGNLVLFVHIPKTGGSTIEEALHNAGAKQALKHNKLMGFSNSTPQHMTWDVTRFWIPKGFYDYAFAVVRHPLNRLMSEYYYRTSLADAPLPEFEKWVVQKFKRHKEYPYVNDNHIRPQVDFVGPAVEIFRLEDGIEKPIAAGMSRLGLPPATARIGNSRKSDPTPLAISAKVLAQTCRFYAADFKAFGYNPTDIPPMMVVS